MNRSLILICVFGVAGCSAKPAFTSLSDVSLADEAVSMALADAMDGEVSSAVVAQAVAQVEPPKAGLFGRMFGGGAPVKAGFLSGSGGAKEPDVRTGPDAQDVAVGAVLPYGEIARNCGVSRRALGVKVDENAGYTLYDSDPAQTGLRTHYITGFKDKCARQFTAATSLMGDIGTHEIVRYMPTNRGVAYNVTDAAYEAVKSSFCRVKRGAPCGAKLDRLARSTTFITAYEQFGSNPTWSNILLHDGGVIAMGPADH